MKFLTSSLLLLGALTQSALSEPIPTQSSSLAKRDGVSVFCLTTKCAGALASCVPDSTCSSGVGCLRGCKGTQDEQTLCQLTCTERHNSQKLDKLAICIFEKKCQPVPNNQCFAPRYYQQDASARDVLSGTWHVVRGVSRAYDCFPQRFDFGGSAYRFTFEPAEGVRGQVDGWVSTSGAGRFLQQFEAHGFPGSKDTFVLSYKGDYALIYYCGSSPPSGSYPGAIVVSRYPSLSVPSDVISEFTRVLQNAGIDAQFTSQGFCRPSKVIA
ncbi:hypothetical protein HK102_005430 [Quaeritorhiza haematococci]|nr:hypothetical protein HK102_005430 [Quaeritorhiza haematococci]